MRRADFHGPLRMVSAIRIRYRFRNKIKCMRRKIKRKNGTFFRPLRKAEAFPVGFPRDIRKWLLFCGYATFQHLACERQTFLLAHRPLSSLKFAKRLSAAMSEEKRLPFAGYQTPVILYIYIYFRRSTIKLPLLIDFTTYEKFIQKTCLIVLPF